METSSEIEIDVFFSAFCSYMFMLFGLFQSILSRYFIFDRIDTWIDLCYFQASLDSDVALISVLRTLVS